MLVFGELVALLRAQGRCDSAAGVAKWWKELIRVRPMLLYCACPNEALTDPVSATAYRQLCVDQGRILEAHDMPFEASMAAHDH